MGWERGIVNLISHNSTYVATSYDQATMYIENNYKLGDCIEFIADDRRIIIESRRCERFVDFDLKFSGISIVLICKVVDVRTEFVNFWNRRVRCFRTNFIEKVYDIPMNPKTDFYTEDQLIGSKIVICRVPTSDKVYSFWKVSSVSEIHGIKQVQSIIKVTDLIRPIENSQRTHYTGWICTYGTTNNGKDELFVWIPFGKHGDIMFPPNLRNNIHRDLFYGRWVTFSMGHPVLPDEESNIQLIDDVFPTRKFDGKWEIKIPCKFDSRERDQTSLLHSDVVGNVHDIQNTLGKYNRWDSFSENLWVAYNYHDKRRIVRFILSTCQNDWEQRKYDYENDEPTCSMNQNRYGRFTPEYSDDESFQDRKRKGSSEFSFPKENSNVDPIPGNEIESLKIELLRLETKHRYLLENSLPIPEKLAEDLKRTRNKVSGSSKSVNDQELESYKKLVIHFRDMLSSDKVCEEMRKFDAEKLEEINELMFDM